MNSRLPSGDFLSKMFGLPQETHPERLFVLKELGDAEGRVIYDLGCGRHKTIPNSIGVDIEPVADIRASVDELPMIQSGTADFIISRHSFEHLLDPIKTLKEWKRILRPDGKIILVLPDFSSLDTMNPLLSGGVHLHAYTMESLKNIVTSVSKVFTINTLEPVVPGWSFGMVIQKSSQWMLMEKDKEGDHDKYMDLWDMASKIRNNENFSFVKCGDGEMLAMLGAKGANCDGQEYSDKLATALKAAYKSFSGDPDVKITRWKLPGMEKEIANFEEELGIKMTEDHDLLMNRVGEITREHYNFWKEIKNSNRRKVFVGPERLTNVMKFLNIDEMKVIPQSNAFDYKMDFYPDNDEIWIFSGGMAAKTWIAEVLNFNPNVTCIDAGSAFDPIFVGYTRTNQISPTYIREFYKPLL